MHLKLLMWEVRGSSEESFFSTWKSNGPITSSIKQSNIAWWLDGCSLYHTCNFPIGLKFLNKVLGGIMKIKTEGLL